VVTGSETQLIKHGGPPRPTTIAIPIIGLVVGFTLSAMTGTARVYAFTPTDSAHHAINRMAIANRLTIPICLADAPAEESTDVDAGTLRDDPRYRRWRFAITWGLVILIMFVTAAAAIVVFSRRFRRWIGREKKVPTPDEDVWAMHKPPDDPADLN